MNRQLVEIAALVSFACAVTSVVRGSNYESFESAQTTWQLGPRDCWARIDRHERRFTEAHGGRGCEYIEFATGPGTKLQFVHPVTPALVIPELLPSLWLKSDQPGVQLQARVVFPRSTDRDGKPLSSLIHGDIYTNPQTWRQLRIEDLSQKVQRAAVALRTHPGITVDEREAYVDRLVLNAFTVPQSNRLWIDDLEMQGLVEASRIGTEAQRPAPPADPGSPAAPTPREREPFLGLRGNILMAGGQPLFVRAVEHGGETFALLQSLGFNTVWLRSPPTDVQLAEAERADVWLIAPPPLTSSGVGIQAAHRKVLAWFLGRGLTAPDAERVSYVVREIRQAEPLRERPVLLHVASDYSQFQHDGGIHVFERTVLGTSFELNDFGPWLTYAARHNRPDAAYWAAIPTELSAELRGQIAQLSRQATPPACAEADAIRWLAFEAAARGARGLCFRSDSRLDGRDSAAQLRAAILQALNQELELVAPWVAAGRSEGQKATSEPRIRVASLQTESARMLIVSRIVSDQQFVTAPMAHDDPITFDVRGTQISDRAYQVAASGIAPIAVQRGGGVKVTLDASQPVSLVLLTQDSLALNYVGRISADIRASYAARQIEIAQSLLDETEAVDRQLATRHTPKPQHEPALLRARADLRQASALLDGGDASHAIPIVARSFDACRRIRRSHWESAVLSFPSPLASPLCTSFATLPLHYAVADRLAQTRWSINVLAAGDMEQLEHLLQSGWRQQCAELARIGMDLRLTLETPHAGRACLQLRTWEMEGRPPSLDGQWPLTVTSAPVSVREGQLVRIHGWVKVPSRFPDSWDGLLIFDSQTGPELAERILETQGWREFVLYRVAPTSGELQIVFAHTGIGETWLDDVSVTLQDP